jgi:hypothetical protein
MASHIIVEAPAVPRFLQNSPLDVASNSCRFAPSTLPQQWGPGKAHLRQASSACSTCLHLDRSFCTWLRLKMPEIKFAEGYRHHTLNLSHHSMMHDDNSCCARNRKPWNVASVKFTCCDSPHTAHHLQTVPYPMHHLQTEPIQCITCSACRLYQRSAAGFQQYNKLQLHQLGALHRRTAPARLPVPHPPARCRGQQQPNGHGSWSDCGNRGWDCCNAPVDGICHVVSSESTQARCCQDF